MIKEICTDFRSNKWAFIALAITVVLLLVSDYIPEIYQWYSIVGMILTYLIAAALFVKAQTFDYVDKKDILEGWEFYHRFYTGIGYSILAAGLVSFVIEPELFMKSLAVTFLGAFFVLVGESSLSKKKRFKNSVSKAE